MFFAGLFFSPVTAAQHSSFAQRDSVANEICKAIQRLEKPDSAELYFTVIKNMVPFVTKFPKELRSDEFMFVGLRLNRCCFEYIYYAARVAGQYGDWQVEKALPKARADAKDCADFFEQKDFRYLETNGDTVTVRIADGYWMEQFRDSTYSKLSIALLGDCRFEAAFIESDNKLRKNLSQPGEKYIYQILDRRNGYFLISSEIPGVRGCSVTKFYLIQK